jgi:hypothetical protein
MRLLPSALKSHALPSLALAAAVCALSGCDKSTDDNASAGLISISSPAAGAAYKVGDTLTVKWTVKTDPVKVVDAADVLFSPDGGQNWATLNSGSIPPESPKWANFKWAIADSVYITTLNKKIPVKGSKTCIVKVEEYSTSDPALMATTGAFTVD